jgi:hypothetical protein
VCDEVGNPEVGYEEKMLMIRRVIAQCRTVVMIQVVGC